MSLSFFYPFLFLEWKYLEERPNLSSFTESCMWVCEPGCVCVHASDSSSDSDKRPKLGLVTQPVIPGLRRLKVEDGCKFEASLGYRMSSRLA